MSDISAHSLRLLRERAAQAGCSVDELLNRLLAEDSAQTVSSHLYQLLLEHASDTIVIFDPELRYVYVNPVMGELTGFEPADMLGKTDEELGVTQDQVEQWHQLWQTVIDSGQEQVSSFTFETPNGLRHFESRLTPILGSDNSLQYFFAITRDVTERAQAEQKLLESERFINTILRTVPNFIYIYDLIENRNVFSNASLTTIMGFKPEEFQALETNIIGEMVHPDDISVLMDNINRIKSSTEEYVRYSLIYRLRHKDGSWRWVQDQAVIFKRDEAGVAQQMLGSVIDVTERKESEQQLRIKDSAIHSALTPTALADLEGRLTYVNPAFLKLWKLDDEQQVLGRSVLDFWTSPESAQEIIQSIAESDHYIGELTALLADGTAADVELMASMVRDGYGNPICMVGSFNDVTKHKQAELFLLENERLKARFQKEQERNILVQRIISALSHDLRAPLTNISTSASMLNHYFDRMPVEKRVEKLETIARQVQFALNMLDDTVNLARGNLHEGDYQPAPINLAALCQVSVDEVRNTDNQRHHLRFVNLDGLEIAVVNEVLVSRILLNLLSNAIKYSPDHREIRLELDRYDQWVMLRVIDQGIGISEDDLPYIFDPFYRSTAARDIGGTGMGLSIVKDCVERHQGRIHVASQVGQGSTFTVELPFIEVAAPP